MAQGSRIEWTDATWNPVAGCTPVSPGCLNCYAARMALRLSHMPGPAGRKYAGTAKKARDGRPVFAGSVNLDWDSLELPTRWKLPRTIFVNSMSDLFHEDVPLEFIQRVFQVMAECPQHVFQVLTKRPERALAIWDKLTWSEQVWLGTSVESSKYYERVRVLQRIPAKIRFLSCEPLLGQLARLPLKGIHWVIVGGESGPAARPMDGMWVIDIREQCEAKGVPFFFKQWGGVHKKQAGRLLEGRTWSAVPAARSPRGEAHAPEPCCQRQQRRASRWCHPIQSIRSPVGLSEEVPGA